MEPAHPIVKIVTAVFFIAMVFGFVSYRAGAFENEQNKMPETNYALKTNSQARPAASSPAPARTDPIQNALNEEQRMRMMVGSKSAVVFEPSFRNPVQINPSSGISGTMISSSKSIAVFVPDRQRSPLMSAALPFVKKDNRPILRQKK